jgi:hypothetical protein
MYKSTSTKLVLIAKEQLPQQLLQKKSAVITSSPGFKSNPIIAICSISTIAHGMTCFTSKYSSNDFEIVVLADR